MTGRVYRFIITCVPTSEHPRYFAWQKTHIIMLLQAATHEQAEATAFREIGRKHWSPVEVKIKDILVEERVKSEGGAIWESYQKAKNGELIWLEQPVDIPFSTKDKPPSFMPPRLDEPFVDSLIEACGGHRLTREEAGDNKVRNSDYILNEYVFELKDLQTEGLLVTTRQEKIAEIFDKYDFENPFQVLDLDLLTDADFKEYMEIVGKPVQKRITDAAKQIKSTITHLNIPNKQGYVILLNSGYSTLPLQLLEECAARYAKKDTSQVKSVIIISTWALTNGFDFSVNFAFSPPESEDENIRALKKAFDKAIDVLMNEWARSGFQHAKNGLTAMVPITFTHKDKKYTYAIPELESTISKRKTD